MAVTLAFDIGHYCTLSPGLGSQGNDLGSLGLDPIDFCVCISRGAIVLVHHVYLLLPATMTLVV